MPPPEYHCKVCGVGLLHMFDPPPEYCNRHLPFHTHNKVTSTVLNSFPSVASAYRQLVERDAIEYDIPSCGDFLYLNAHQIARGREEFPPVRENPHLVPFAQDSSGSLWCWTSFRSGPNSEPEILWIDYYGAIVVYAPTFPTFLYRAALEEASDQSFDEGNYLSKKINAMAAVLLSIGVPELADDLAMLAIRPLSDFTLPGARDKCFGLLTELETRLRIERYLGASYLSQRYQCESDFLGKAERQTPYHQSRIERER